MMSTEELNLLWLKIPENRPLIEELRAELAEIERDGDYRAWWPNEPRTPFTLPQRLLASCPTLASAGFVKDGSLCVKVNRIGERLFVTDGAWVPHALRVFPDPDEAFALLDEVRALGLDDWAEWVIDPAAGCGHTPLGFTGSARRISCDANVRAILYASINGALNGFGPDHFLPLLNNMKNGVPFPVAVRGRTLFLANVPFAPAPKLDGALAVNSAGGRSGAELQVASFRMAERFQRETGNPVKACFLTWTLGAFEEDRWEVPELCRNIFPQGEIRWHLVHQDYDAPELPNPAPLRSMLKHLARSQYAVRRDEDVMAAYDKLADELGQEGWTHIAYGMLEVDLTADARDSRGSRDEKNITHGPREPTLPDSEAVVSRQARR